MRYVEKKSVASVISRLAEMGTCCKRGNFQKQLRYVLTAFTDAEAEQAKVDLPLLRAVRQRLALPLRPRGPRAGKRSLRRFISGGVERRLWIRSAPKRASKDAPVPVSPRTGSSPISRDVAPAPETLPEPKTLDDWRAVQARAVKKIPTNIMNNWYGTVVDLETNKYLSQAEVVQMFGLTEHEAESLFLTL